jgi:hypothetical protein
MLHQRAEDSYARGVRALTRTRTREALALFETAIEIERRNGAEKPQPRYVSFYGLCLALEKHRLHEGISFCREALAQEFYNPDLCCNLGRLLVMANKRKEGYAILCKGYRLQPNHPGIRAALRDLGQRRRPPLPFLSRANPINILLGRMTRGPAGAR